MFSKAISRLKDAADSLDAAKSHHQGLSMSHSALAYEAGERRAQVHGVLNRLTEIVGE